MAYDHFCLPTKLFVRRGRKNANRPAREMHGSYPPQPWDVTDAFLQAVQPKKKGISTAQGEPEVPRNWMSLILSNFSCYVTCVFVPKNSTSFLQHLSILFWIKLNFCWNQGWFISPAESEEGSPCNHLHIWIICTIPGFARDRKPNGWILWWIALMPETKSWEIAGPKWFQRSMSIQEAIHFSVQKFEQSEHFLSFKEIESLSFIIAKSSIV